MAESQLMCMDDGHINEKISESKPEFYYSEEQRAALEQLLKDGECAFKSRLKADNVNDFLSAPEIKAIRNTFQEYGMDDEEDLDSVPDSGKTDSGIHSTYWPELSDVEVPPLDIGWPDGGFYKGVTRVTVHAHPPKEDGPHIKQVVRKLIQEANKVVAMAMDLLTDLQILQDLLDAASKRNVSVYILLDAVCVPHFLDTCSRLQIGVLHLKNIRVRTVQGTGLCLSFGKLPGSLSSKYMLVDGDKVMFGSYSFTWSSSRLDRGMIAVMTGQVVDFFDRDFREMYAVSESVDLYKELHVVKPRAATPVPKPVPAAPRAEPKAIPSAFASTSRFQELPGQRESPGGPDSHTAVQRFLQAGSEHWLAPPPPSPTEAKSKEDGKKPNGLTPTGRKSSFRVRLRVKADNLNSGDGDSMSSGSSPTRAGRRSLSSSPTHGATETSLWEEQGDRFENDISDKSMKPKGKYNALSKLSKSISLLTVNTPDEDGSKVLKRPQKKGCMQS
ncbi:hypothetical protein AAFF_G00295720 [Aldrovandia affinis]|uniref:Scaffolding anchor of CK1 domain-containing protein n=1 Tax=Aldrovandia affinis TaxID=143900 RepID=A0AAD7SRV3_9TELE|nr:hypothetical protein AAFF_G00295720 [Aldrovandia affinis]